MRKHLRRNAEVAHFWAPRSRPEGQTKSMFFEGESIYSYGRHYEAGRLVTADNDRAIR